MQETKKPVGRPTKEQTLNARIEVNCLPQEKEILKQKAQQAGLSLSAYLVKKGLEG
jgi:hypothetical protein